jgi:hypothetical protein
MKSRLLLLLGGLALLSLSSAKLNTPSRTVLDKMYNAIDRASHVSYTMRSEERMHGKMIKKHMKFKVKHSPKKVYMKDQDTGVELLYVKGWNGDNAYINPNGFPWMNVSLDIFSHRVRKDGHHTVLHAGFSYVNKLMRHVEKEIRARGDKVEDYIKLEGDVNYFGRSCYRMLLENPKFAYKSYRCSKSESLYALSERLNLSEYMIMEKNNMGFGAKVKAGQTIQIPNSFAKKVVIYVDKATYMPVYQLIYDNEGLFEKYEFTDVKINPSVSSGEWTTNCSSYGF